MKININQINDSCTVGLEIEKIIRMNTQSVTEITIDEKTYTCADENVWGSLYNELDKLHNVLEYTLNQFPKEELLSFMSLEITDNNLPSILKIEGIDENNVLSVIFDDTEDYDHNDEYFIVNNKGSNGIEAFTCDDWTSFIGFEEFMSYIVLTDDVRGVALNTLVKSIEQNVRTILGSTHNKSIKDMGVDEHMKLALTLIDIDKRNTNDERVDFEKTLRKSLNENEMLKILADNDIRVCNIENIKIAIASCKPNSYVSIADDHEWLYMTSGEHSLNEVYEYHSDTFIPGIIRDVMKSIEDCYYIEASSDKVKELFKITKPYTK